MQQTLVSAQYNKKPNLKNSYYRDLKSHLHSNSYTERLKSFKKTRRLLSDFVIMELGLPKNTCLDFLKDFTVWTRLEAENWAAPGWDLLL